MTWDTERDKFERGQWFHGRIYERRSDLSPDGKLFVYFASKFNRLTLADDEYTYAWTAVSRPPFLTALALWPKGDCWWGGGLFSFKRTLLLNHRPGEDTPHPEHLPNGLRVSPNPSAHGEDDPLYSQRLERDGWILRQDWQVEATKDFGFRTLVPQVRVRAHPSKSVSLVMSRAINGFRSVDRFELEREGGRREALHCVWADWDQTGRLVTIANGKLSVSDIRGDQIEAPRELIDLTPDRPGSQEAPPWATRWPWDVAA